MHCLDTRRMPYGVTNEHEIRMVGMSRSGNHAIINWVLSQAPGRTCYLNCVEPKTNPFRSARPAQGQSCRANFPFDLRMEREGTLSRKDWLVYNYEDCFLGLVSSPEYERRRDEYVGTSARRTDALVLRDPFNLFASRKRGIHSPVPVRTAARIWKQHARAVLGSGAGLGPDSVCILYNRWVCDRSYRAAVAASLGVPFTDAGFNRVARCGGGSSFDGMRFDGKAERMDVFHRWRYYEEDSDYREFFDDQLVELSRRAFSTLPRAAQQPLAEAEERLGLATSSASTLREAA